MADIQIRPLGGEEEIATCARMMAASDPWITLGRGFEASYKSIADPIKEVYVALAGDEIAGFIILNMTGPFVGYIQSICVAPNQRGLGVGSQLVAFAEARIFKVTPNVFICVSSFNQNARRLYERLGYEFIGELRDYLVRGYSELLLRKTIGSLDEFHARQQADSPA